MTPANLEAFGEGPTKALSLRVSAAALARVTFPHPQTGQTTLALERKAALLPSGGAQSILVTAQPFGGGVRINQPDALAAQIGAFHFDSPRSRAEQDFRIMIRPEDWGTVRQYCLHAFRDAKDSLIETDPLRELVEEFQENLRVALSPTQLRITPLELLVENEPAATTNPRAAAQPTTRIYAVFEAALVDPALVQRVLADSASISGDRLAARAEADARSGGRGRANAVLALPERALGRAYLELPPEQRGEPILFEGHRLEGNVLALFPDVPVPKYERFPLQPGF